MMKYLIVTLTSVQFALAPIALAETQSETIARVCAEHGQQSQECKDVSGNALQLQLNLSGQDGSQNQSQDTNLDAFDRDIGDSSPTENFDEDVYEDATCASGWRGIDSEQCSDG